MSAAPDIKETLCKYLKSDFWMSKMKFDTIYKDLKPDSKCISLRMSGDNFRAAYVSIQHNTCAILHVN